MTVRVEHGDSREVLKGIASNSVDSCVTDPPYALVSIQKRFGKPGSAPAQEGRDGLYKRASAGFMGKQWDTGETAFDPAFWREVYRVLKPGAHLVAFSGTRTYHRLACAIEDAGFEIRDGIYDLIASDATWQRFLDTLSGPQAEAFARCLESGSFDGMLAWLYGTGFPKSHDVSKGIDKHKGDVRPIIGRETITNDMRGGALLDAAHGTVRPAFERDITTAASAASAAWEGWGTALKPAIEPICLARKPLIGSVAENVLRHGTGALNIDGCRIEAEKATGWGGGAAGGRTWNDNNCGLAKDGEARPVDGRWPANIVHDGSAEVAEAFPGAPGQRGAVTGDEPSRPAKNTYNTGTFARSVASMPRGDSGSAARFFYSAKADDFDRFGTKHPTVKPVDLMQWLCRLITRSGGLVLDPFAGSGTTGAACIREGFDAILIEREAEYVADIKARLEAVSEGGRHSLAIKHRHVPEEKRSGADLPLFGGAAE